MFDRLKARFRKTLPKGRRPAERMITLKRAGIYYLPIAKSGSTYVKNLFYYLDKGQQHLSGNEIHGADVLVRARAKDVDKIRQSGYAFAVIRDPVDRFLSLYFDKIYGDGPRNFPHYRDMFAAEIGLDLTRGLNAEAHRENCQRLIDWIGKNLSFLTEKPVNPHWRPQANRLKRVASLDLTYLTLDGLDWQLPLFLGDVLPDIRTAMRAVTFKNEASWPVTRDQVLNTGLRNKIETLYAADKRIYQETTQKWQAWAQSDTASEATHLRVLSAETTPLNCIVTLKAGCTYLKNLLYVLDHGAPHPDPLRIHGSNAVKRQNLTQKQLENGISFFVVREPADRFLSLYFDKVYGTGPQAFSWIAKRLQAKRGFVSGDNISLAAHQKNCNALLGYLEHKFAHQDIAVLNPHWRPQIEVAKRAASFGLNPLLLENLEQQLLQIAEARIPNLAAAMKMVPVKNESRRPFSNSEILTPEISRRITALYGDDFALYERIKNGWAKSGQPPKL
ncbi:MAG: sulfotransferase family 2 domain-containing protein [Paracoccaceae bacterium]